MQPQIEQEVAATLERLGHPFEVIPCDPAYADTAEFCAHYGYSPEASANTIIVASKRPPGHYAACVVLATTRLDVNKRVRDLLGVRKLSFAPPEATREVTGMMIGGVTPFALPDDLPLFVDARIVKLDQVIFGSGSRSSKILTTPAALTALPQTQVVDGLALSIDP